MTVRPGAKIPTDVDRGAYSSLHHVLKPEYHGLIDDWMRTAGESEKRGIIKLGHFAEPTLAATIGRPRPGGHAPSMTMHTWHTSKQTQQGPGHPSGWPVRDNDMGRSNSSPGFFGGEEPHQHTWQLEDARITGEIAKPGGYCVGMSDTVTIQRKKNLQRNKGTFKLFGGSFNGVTQTSSVHNLRSLGMEYGSR